MKYPVIYFICFFLFLSCKHTSRLEQEIKDLNGRKITFVEGYESLSINDSISIYQIFKKKIKIVSYIENFPCTACTFRMLSEWIKTIEKLDKDVGYLIIINTTEKYELIQNLKIQKISLPMMYYSTDTFKVSNQLDVLARNRTFLLDQNDQIILVGEPFNNKALFNLYKRGIDELKNMEEK